MKNFYLIGLTGNLGSGKSTVRRMLEELGAFGLDADKLAHVAMMRGTPAWNAIVESFGTEILHYNGKIDRHKLGARVFGNPAGLRRLEAILHPAVGELIRLRLRQCRAPVAVLEAVKLIEAGLHQWCDALWVVTAAEQVQIARVMQDRQMTNEEAIERLANQSPIEDKIKKATVVIDNSQDLETTRRQVLKGWEDTVRPERARDKTAWLSGPFRSTRPVAPPAPPSTPISGNAGTEEASTQLNKEIQPDQSIPSSTPLQKIEDSEYVPGPIESLGGSGSAKQADESLRDPASTLAISARPALGEFEKAASPVIQDVDDVTVRRAHRSDLEAMGRILSRIENRPEDTLHDDLIKRLGERGYRIAVKHDSIVAIAAWDVENLVATTRDVWVESPDEAPKVLPALFGLIEEDARTLQCEVSILFLRPGTPDYVLEQLRVTGYEPHDMSGLHRVWLQVIQDRYQPGDTLWLKVLREEIVTKPM